MKLSVTAVALLMGFLLPTGALAAAAADAPTPVLAQAMIPPTGANDADKPMPMVERMNRRFPQPARVGDLIGLPVLDDGMSTLGHVAQVVRTPAGKIVLVVNYSRWFGFFGWFTRPVAVPIEAVGIEGRQIASLDMARAEYAKAPTWQLGAATPLPPDATIRIALSRN